MKRSNMWIVLLALVTLVVGLIIAANVFLVSVGQYHIRSDTNLLAYTESANVRKVTTKANRGYIYDANKEIIAQDIKTYNIVCVLDENRPSPKGQINYVEDPIYTSRVLATLLKTNEQNLLKLLTQDVYQTELGYVGRNLSKEVKDEIQAYNLPGVEFVESIQRSYPLNSFSSYLIGYAQGDDNGTPVGKMGIELFYNDVLTGTDGYRQYQADKNGYVLPGMKEEEVSAINGNDIYLTLDRDIQETLEMAFEQTLADHNASKVWGAVSEIDSGKILAWGQYPSFNPNELVIEDYNNYGSQYAYEAGSVIKILGYAAAINEGVYDGQKLVDSDPFCYSANGRNPVRTYGSNYIGCINNARKKKWGWIEYDYGLIYSSNTITSSLITEVITPAKYEEYIDRFGLFQKVDTDNIPEVEGTKNYTWPSDKLALSYGQGSSVTMLQLLQAFSAVLGDGQMAKPYYIESIKDSYDSSNVIYQANVEKSEPVISADAAKQVQDLMKRVVYDENGTARFYEIPEVEIIAKTGTSQIANPQGGGYTGDYTITSIVLGLPADNPKYMVYYAFESEYTNELHSKTEAVKMILRKIAMKYNLVSSNSTNENVINDYYENFEMPNLINHSVDYAYDKLANISDNIYLFGRGNSIVNQYPEHNQLVYNNQRVFIVTDLNEIFMPNMVGWTRKDVVEFWKISGIAVKIDGYGTVVKQAIPEGTLLNPETLIEVFLE